LSNGARRIRRCGRSLINDPLYPIVIDQVHPNEAGSLNMAEGISALPLPVVGVRRIAQGQRQQLVV
jgi:hypothetical protein